MNISKLSRDNFINACNRISAAGIRKFTQEEADILFEQISGIDDYNFKRAIDEYCSMEHPTKNIEGFLKERDKEYNREFLSKTKTERIPEVNYEDHELYIKCVRLALNKFLPINYKTWSNWFTTRWDTLKGEELTNFLKDHYEKLFNEQGEKDVSENKIGSATEESGNKKA